MNNNISFGRTAYIANTPDDMLDAIERELSPSMTGDGLVLIDWDDLPQEDPGDGASNVEAFLWDTRKNILEVDGGDRLVGDVVFSS